MAKKAVDQAVCNAEEEMRCKGDHEKDILRKALVASEYDLDKCECALKELTGACNDSCGALKASSCDAPMTSSCSAPVETRCSSCEDSMETVKSFCDMADKAMAPCSSEPACPKAPTYPKEPSCGCQGDDSVTFPVTIQGISKMIKQTNGKGVDIDFMITPIEDCSCPEPVKAPTCPEPVKVPICPSPPPTPAPEPDTTVTIDTVIKDSETVSEEVDISTKTTEKKTTPATKDEKKEEPKKPEVKKDDKKTEDAPVKKTTKVTLGEEGDYITKTGAVKHVFKINPNGEISKVAK